MIPGYASPWGIFESRTIGVRLEHQSPSHEHTKRHVTEPFNFVTITFLPLFGLPAMILCPVSERVWEECRHASEEILRAYIFGMWKHIVCKCLECTVISWPTVQRVHHPQC